MFARKLVAALLLLTLGAGAQKTKIKVKTKRPAAAAPVLQPVPAADRFDTYRSELEGKRIALLVNQTSTVKGTHLADFLHGKGMKLQVIFGPEHGFRGNAPDGEKVDNTVDPRTGAKVISLYGKKLKPSAEDLKDVDVMVYDIQDVGARFYTFISSLQYYMEAALENNIPLVILDRPNPIGNIVDGPVLDPRFKTFVGMQPVPIAYGMTPGEYAQMLLFEKMLAPEANAAWERVMTSRYREGQRHFEFQVIPCANYTHKSAYALPVRPSPNLPDMAGIYWYTSTCLFEGTAITEGRGTDHPFATVGAPLLPKSLFAFTPHPTEGAPKPRYNGQTCYGWDLNAVPAAQWPNRTNRIELKYLLEAYRLYPQKDSFFKANFTRLAGTDELQKQIVAGKTEAEIRASWAPALQAFRALRKKHLIYPE